MNKFIGDRLKQVRTSLKKGSQAEFAVELGVDQSTISKYEKGTLEIPDEIKAKIGEFGINLHWLISGQGEMFLQKPVEKEGKVSPIAELGAIIDRRFERLEAKIVEMEGRIKAGPPKDPDSGMFVSEPEPEYGEDQEDVTFVEGIAAGKPIFQSEARSTIPVPKRYIKTKPEDYYVGRIKGTSMTAAGIPDGVLVLIRFSDIPKDGAIQVVERQGEATLKRMREIPGKGWKICFDDHTGRYIEMGPGDEFHIQGDFIAVLPED
ncbi:MAG: XRE family transcriptional regulator [Spirochaetaceae bacterium]|jgi:SOS-response transcriptional repressor LexA|nr:XRE family transcriptional regulator [Spirochaetaceae bacterium]